MSDLEGLLEAIVGDPLSEDRWLVLADWLEEHDDPRRAELLRLHRRLLATCCEPDQHPKRASGQARIVELLGQGVKPCVPQRSVRLAEGVEMTFSFIPPGRFLMGGDHGEKGWSLDPRVTVSQGFWLGICPVTEAQWHAVMGERADPMQGASLPVQIEKWDECQRLLKLLEGSTGHQFRLPTETEREYAARAGSTTPSWPQEVSFPNQIEDGDRNKEATRDATNIALDCSTPNAWGLYCIHFDSPEWTQDWFEWEAPSGQNRWNCRIVLSPNKR